MELIHSPVSSRNRRQSASLNRPLTTCCASGGLALKEESNPEFGAGVDVGESEGDEPREVGEEKRACNQKIKRQVKDVPRCWMELLRTCLPAIQETHGGQKQGLFVMGVHIIIATYNGR